MDQYDFPIEEDSDGDMDFDEFEDFFMDYLINCIQRTPMPESDL